MAVKHERFVYDAKVVKVYDGDTVTVDIDLGFNVILRGVKIRLWGINTPEVRGEERQEGLRSRDVVVALVLDRNVVLKTRKDKTGKYGRYLGEIFCDGTDSPDQSLNDYLVAHAFAKPFMRV